MIDITVVGQVLDEGMNKIEVRLEVCELEEMILAKAKAMGIKGYMGRILRHWDESIIKVNINE